MLPADTHSAQPDGENRQRHHGRRGLSRTLSFLRPVRNFPSFGMLVYAIPSEDEANRFLVRQALVRIRMRSRCSRSFCSALRLQLDVAPAVSGRSQCRFELQQLPRILAFLFDPHTWSLQLCPWLLPTTAGVRELAGSCATSRHIHRLLPRQPCHRMVHLLKLSNVHRRWSNDEHERSCGIPSGTVLRRIWNHGSFLQPRNWENGSNGEDRRCMKEASVDSDPYYRHFAYQKHVMKI